MIENEDVKIFNKICEQNLALSQQFCNNSKCPKIGCLMKIVNRKRDKNAKNMILLWRCTICGSFRSPYDQTLCSKNLSRSYWLYLSFSHLT